MKLYRSPISKHENPPRRTSVLCSTLYPAPRDCTEHKDKAPGPPSSDQRDVASFNHTGYSIRGISIIQGTRFDHTAYIQHSIILRTVQKHLLLQYLNTREALISAILGLFRGLLAHTLLYTRTSSTGPTVEPPIYNIQRLSSVSLTTLYIVPHSLALH